MFFLLSTPAVASRQVLSFILFLVGLLVPEHDQRIAIFLKANLFTERRSALSARHINPNIRQSLVNLTGSADPKVSPVE